MADILKTLVKNERILEQRTTNENKKKIINLVNKLSKDYGFKKLSKDSSVREINALKKDYIDRVGYDILVQASEQGNTTIASVYSKDLKKSKDRDTSILAEFAEELASAKKQANKSLTKEEIDFLEKGNQNIKGYGNESIITLFEEQKSIKGIKKLIEDIKTQDTKQLVYDKKIDLFDTVFQRVGIKREKELDKLKEHLRGMDIERVSEISNTLLASLELYGSEAQDIQQGETELLDNRLDDMLIKTGIKKTGKRKVESTYKKYKS